MTFAPDRTAVEDVLDVLNKDKNWCISRCFSVGKKHLKNVDLDENELEFCVGTVLDEYTQIDREVLGVKHDFYFSNGIKLDKRHFVAYRNISILAKIDQIIDTDIYIGGNYPDGCIPVDTFESLLRNFPKTAELDYYAQARIATIIKEHFPKTEAYEIHFARYLERKEKTLNAISLFSAKTVFQENASTEFRQFRDARNCLSSLLDREQSVSEQVWQEQIHGILRLLYPKYIVAFREVVIKGVDRHDKRPDFLLVDANGCIDVLEIKKPSVQLLTKQSSYRNNYVPVRDLAGAIQQIEKYIYCLNTWGKEGEKELQRQLSTKLPATVAPTVVNPQGILLLGRSKDFNSQQKRDFELIKRQYKHIAEIMTYDDLLQRIDNIIEVLSHEQDIK